MEGEDVVIWWNEGQPGGAVWNVVRLVVKEQLGLTGVQ